MSIMPDVVRRIAPAFSFAFGEKLLRVLLKSGPTAAMSGTSNHSGWSM